MLDVHPPHGDFRMGLGEQHDSLSQMDHDELSRLSYRHYMEGVINQQGADLFAAF